jgi:ABC-type transport system substrate-binding protein/class 3 adenylate cyclase
LPTGTVTFLFSDIEGSTKLLQRLGDRYAGVLADHQRLLRHAWAVHDGVEVDTQGDSFFVAFALATDALAAAAEAQRALAEHTWPAGEQVRVRMGLHTGVGTLSHDHNHYVGLDVHRTARIAAAGHGGQVLLSQATRDQVAKELIAGQGIRDLGRHRLKDLPRREEIYQLVLPGLPADYPPLKTLDAWPGLRADLVAVVLISAGLLAVLGLLLPLAVASFPRWIGLGAVVLAGLVLLTSVVVRPARRALIGQWRDARKPFASVTSSLLSLVVVLTTLLVARPVIFIGPVHLGYDFTYNYHAPTHTGGTVTIGVPFPYLTNAPVYISNGPVQPFQAFLALSQACLTQIPDVSQGLDSFKPDQCTEVPVIANGGESPDYKTTTFHIDPRAVWSDGVPVTADDYVFANLITEDPNIYGVPHSHYRTYTALDARTVRIDWAQPSGFYLGVLASVLPLPLHAYATGAFAGIYNPHTGAYNSALAQKLLRSSSLLAATPVVDGPFMVETFVPGQRAVMVRNPRYISNFFHSPALDGVTFVTDEPDPAHLPPHSQSIDTLVSEYRQGTLDEVEQLGPLDLGRLGGIPKAQVVTSPVINIVDINFSQRAQAPNAQANHGLSIFDDIAVRKAFVEAFDRCGAVHAQLGISPSCNDRNLFTDELSAPPAPDYDPTVTLPGYNPTDAAHLMTQAGYPLVDGIRRYKDGQTPIELTVAVSPGASGDTIIEQRMQQDYARNLGISVTFTSPSSSHFGDLINNGTFDIALWVDTGSIDPVLNALNILGYTDAVDIPTAQAPGPNFLGIVDPYIVKQDKLAEATQDPKQAAEIEKQRLRYVTHQIYVEPLFISGDVALVKPTLCNFKKFPQFGFNTWNIADWYVAPSCAT